MISIQGIDHVVLNVKDKKIVRLTACGRGKKSIYGRKYM